jgi:hypothetical protein
MRVHKNQKLLCSQRQEFPLAVRVIDPVFFGHLVKALHPSIVVLSIITPPHLHWHSQHSLLDAVHETFRTHPAPLAYLAVPGAAAAGGSNGLGHTLHNRREALTTTQRKLYTSRHKLRQSHKSWSTQDSPCTYSCHTLLCRRWRSCPHLA